MSRHLQKDIRSLLEAVAFAARAHEGQVRKDGRTPYASHVFRVCLILRHVFGIDDAQILMAAALHDTLEDTTTDFDDLEKEFGREVAGWVAVLSKDKRMPEDEREKAYLEELLAAPWQVKVCKLADIYDNLMDSAYASADQRARLFRIAHRYLDGLKSGLSDQTREPWKIVSDRLVEMEAGK